MQHGTQKWNDSGMPFRTYSKCNYFVSPTDKHTNAGQKWQHHRVDAIIYLRQTRSSPPPPFYSSKSSLRLRTMLWIELNWWSPWPWQNIWNKIVLRKSFVEIVTVNLASKCHIERTNCTAGRCALHLSDLFIFDRVELTSCRNDGLSREASRSQPIRINITRTTH